MTRRRPELIAQLLRRFDMAEAERLATELDLLGIEPAFIAELIDAGERLPLMPPPPGLTQRLDSLFAAHGPTPGNIVQEADFDSRRQPALTGVRGATQPTTGWTLVFDAEAFDVVVDVFPRPRESFDLEVTVVPISGAADLDGVAVGIDSATWKTLDAMGRARFDGVARGTHRLVCNSPTSTKRIDLEL